MGREIVYCSECKTVLRGADFEKGRGFHVGAGVLCKDCARTRYSEQELRAMKDQEQAPAAPAAAPPPPVPSSTARIAFARPAPSGPGPGLWLGIGGGVLLLVVAVLLAGGRRRPEPRPLVSAPAAPVAAPAPVPFSESEAEGLLRESAGVSPELRRKILERIVRDHPDSRAAAVAKRDLDAALRGTAPDPVPPPPAPEAPKPVPSSPAPLPAAAPAPKPTPPPAPAPEAPKPGAALAAARRFDEAIAAGAEAEELRLAKTAYEAALAALAKLPAGPLKTPSHEGRLRKAGPGGLDFEDGVWLPSPLLPALFLEEVLRKQRAPSDAERKGFEVLARTDAGALPADEREARDLWTAAERDFPSMESRGAAIAAYWDLAGRLKGTELARRTKERIESRSAAGREYVIGLADLAGRGAFGALPADAKGGPGAPYWICGREGDPETWLEFSYWALADTTYRAWVFAGGCCAETFTWTLSGTDLPEGPWKHGLTFLSRGHGGKEHPGATRWEWLPLTLPKGGPAGLKRVRFAPAAKGAAVAMVVVSASREAAPRKPEAAALAKAAEALRPSGPAETFSGPPPDWRSFNADREGAGYGYRPSAEAGGRAGEAGGRFSRSPLSSYYADIALAAKGDAARPLTITGRLDIAGAKDPDCEIRLGFLNRAACENPKADHVPFIGVSISEPNSPRGFRVSPVVCFGAQQGGSVWAATPIDLPANGDYRFTFCWTPSGNGGTAELKILGKDAREIGSRKLTAGGAPKVPLDAFGFHSPVMSQPQAASHIDIFADDLDYSGRTK